MEPQSSYPCIICHCPLRRVFDYEAQPDDGVMCRTSGNYGSTAYDPMDGRYLRFNICDTCLREAGERGEVFETRSSRPIWAWTRYDGERFIKSIIGWQDVPERPLVQWREGLPSDDDHIILDLEDGTIDDTMHFNIDIERHRAQLKDEEKQ